MLAVAAGCSIYDAELLSDGESRGGSAGTGRAGSGSSGQGGAPGTGASAGGGSAGTAAGKGGKSGGGTGPSGGRGAGQSEGGAPAEAGGAGEGGEAGDAGGDGGSGGSAAGQGGKGGTVSAGGTSGGGKGGTAGNGGTTAGSGGQIGGSAGSAGGGSETCSGCARLSVPLTLSTERQHYVIDLPGATDFSAGSITYRVRVIAGSGGEIRAYAQHGGTPDYDLTYGGLRKLDAIASWTTVTWDLGAAVTTFDKTRIARIGIEVTGANSSSFTNPTILYLDSISVSGPSVGPYAFDTAAALSSSTTRPAPGIFWLSAEPDEALPGSTLSWLGP